MTTQQQTHIDVIRAAEAEAAQIIADADKAAHTKVDAAQVEAQSATDAYAQSVAQAQKKRLVSQEQQLIEAVAKVTSQAQEEAVALKESARARVSAAVADVVAAL